MDWVGLDWVEREGKGREGRETGERVAVSVNDHRIVDVKSIQPDQAHKHPDTATSIFDNDNDT